MVSRSLKLMVDYGCWPLWDASTARNINPADLPLSQETQQRLRSWAAMLDRTLDHEYPPNSCFPTEEARLAFKQEGAALREAVQGELGLGYSVTYDDWV